LFGFSQYSSFFFDILLLDLHLLDQMDNRGVLWLD